MSLRVAFVRPRLGMGGAERLVVDAARGLCERGHHAAIFAPDDTTTPQFEDVRSSGFAWDKTGGRVPESLLGRFRAPASILRAGIAGRRARGFRPEVVIADVTAHIVPWLRRTVGVPVVFYCHFPDALLTRSGARDNPLYGSYRRPLDRLESRGLASADLVLANSAFTAARLREAFPVLRDDVQVLRPGIDAARFPHEPLSTEGEMGIVVVSRFDPRKNLGLALESFAASRHVLPPDLAARTRLHLAGRYDERLKESAQTLLHLRARAAALGIEDAVRFHLSPADAAVRGLLAASRLALYTPIGEHFGYGPLEAMASGRPVVAVDGAGPSETIVNGLTGFLRPPSVEGFRSAIVECVRNSAHVARMGEAGRHHVEQHFSLRGFSAALEGHLEETVAKSRSTPGPARART